MLVGGAVMLGVLLSLFLTCSLIHKLGRPLQNAAFFFSVPPAFPSFPFLFFPLGILYLTLNISQGSHLGIVEVTGVLGSLMLYPKP